MDLDLSVFHFLRPWWLLGIPVALLLWWARRGELDTAGRDSRIAPALLPYLIVKAPGSRGPRPIDALGLILAVGALAAAGPTWQRDDPVFLDNVAPLIVAVDLSPSMDAADVPPSRLEAAKHVLRDLAARRAGARTGLIAYAGSSHLVLPPTDDTNLLDLFAQALSTDLIASQGRDAAGAIALATRVLAAERAGGTLLLLTDGADPQQRDAVRKNAQAARDMQILVMAVGQTGQARSGIDTAALRDLADAAGAPLGSLTHKIDDLDWIALHAQQHFRAVQDAQAGPAHWKDAGYWLCWLLAAMALLAIRRGWNVAWTASLLVAIMLGAPQDTRAGALADAFLTADQQGRLAFEQGHYDVAAEHFRDPYWKGRAAYDAGNYADALAAFATMDTAEGYFYVGNTQTRLRQYDAALAAYEQALALKPGWQPAMVNRDIVTRLLAAMSQEQQGQPAEPPDRTIADKTAQAGKIAQVPVAQATSEDMWLRNLSLSPARFLRGKFAAEDAAAGGRP
ncbi:VWA domain-containing protein [Bordetella sp. BOR01]|uniref:VWA domain-containing protein n=1 Tax=Bordetella sp. BOR01 TaxID=2854779 RepID=UPI001C466224|nr:VWA domain-containing protein [Bordetella sp. BOR01]MBV7482419.1 VWA domain-containing protein [Bordetella sp. BOR01]